MDIYLHKAKNSRLVIDGQTDYLTEAAKDEGLTKTKSKKASKENSKSANSCKGAGSKTECGANSASRAAKKICGQTMIFDNPVYIAGRSTYVGTKEGKGPLGKYFHKVAKDDKLKEKTFEGAEIKMLEESILSAIKNSGKKVKEIDLLLAGDLINQITCSSFVARQINVPFVGLYSACSTMSSSLAIGASLINAGYYNNIACATSSHFATAERQYRYPLEYGCQRPPYAQWTVTGAACSVLSSGGSGARVTMATLGRVVDFGTSDLNNMGAAMAPVNAIIPPMAAWRF